MKTLNLIVTVAAVGLLAGCASSMQSDDLQSATAYQLGLKTEDVTILDRRDEGYAANYRIRTRDGREFSCVRTAAPSIIGVAKSSPLCNATNAKAKASAPPPSNALLQEHQRRQSK